MSLAAALAAQPAARRGTPCTVGVVLDGLDQDDRAAAIQALADRTRTATSIAEALTSIGHPVAKQTVQRHRRGECRCDR